MKKSRNISRKTRIVMLIMLIAFAVRMALFIAGGMWNPDVERDSILTSDSYWYHLAGKNLMQYKMISLTEEGPPTPDAHLTPGYPAFITLHYLLFGIKPWTVLVTQIILQIFWILGIFMLGKEIGLPFGVTVIAGLIVALDPVAIVLSNSLLTESLFTLLIFYSVLFLIKCIKLFKWRRIFISALLMSAGMYVKPGGLFLMPVFMLVIFIISYRSRFSTKVSRAIVFIVICALFLAPWLIRNKILFDRPGLSYHLSVHMRTHAKVALIEAKDVSKEEADEIIDARLAAEEKKDFENPWLMHEAYERVYRDIISENFMYWLKAFSRNQILLHVTPGTGRYIQIFKGAEEGDSKTITSGEIFWAMRKDGLLKGIEYLMEKKGAVLTLLIFFTIMLNLFVALFSIIGIGSFLKSDRIILCILLLIFLSFSLSMGPILDPRYRIYSLWVLGILSGAGFFKIREFRCLFRRDSVIQSLK